MWTFQRCLPPDANVIAPQALMDDAVLPHSPQGKSWWRADGAGDLPSKAKTSAMQVKNFMLEAEALYNLSPVKRYAVGFSQGAMLISALIQQEGSFLSGAALLAGIAVEFPNSENLAHFPVFAANGTKDEVVALERAERSKAYLEKLGCKVTSIVEDVGHKVGSTGMRALKDWFQQLDSY